MFCWKILDPANYTIVAMTNTIKLKSVDPTPSRYKNSLMAVAFVRRITDATIQKRYKELRSVLSETTTCLWKLLGLSVQDRRV